MSYRTDSIRHFDLFIPGSLFNLILYELHQDINPQFSIHGLDHWRRVAWNAQRLMEDVDVHKRLNIDKTIVYHFAYLHDSCRINDGHDIDHGVRAAERVIDWWAKGWVKLTQGQALTLATACQLHNYAHQVNDPTIACCLDADRLDLGRCGIICNPDRLSLPKSHNWVDGCLPELIRNPIAV